MKAVTIRDLRLHWPATEESLNIERELLVTRDGRPVAKLVKVSEHRARRRRWNPTTHKKWQARLWKGEQVDLVAKYLETDRSARG